MKQKLSYIDEEDISNKRILLRADFDVALDAHNTIADDFRIRQRIPTLEYLLKKKKQNDKAFAQKLADLAEVYINDAFAMCHREEASVVGVPQLLPSYAGLQLKQEIKMISTVIKNPKKPMVVIIGGSKISTKIAVI